MASIGIRELARKASKVVAAVAETGRPLLVTRRGKPTALIIPVDERDLEDYILATADEYLESMRSADADLKAGRVVSLAELQARLHDSGSHS